MRHRSTWANALSSLTEMKLNYAFQITHLKFHDEEKSHVHRVRLIKSTIFRLCARTETFSSGASERKVRAQRWRRRTTSLSPPSKWMKWWRVTRNDWKKKNIKRQKCCNLVQTAIDFFLSRWNVNFHSLVGFFQPVQFSSIFDEKNQMDNNPIDLCDS